MSLSLILHELHRVDGLTALVSCDPPSSSSSSSSSQVAYLLSSSSVGDREVKVKEESAAKRGVWRLGVAEVEGGDTREGYGEWEVVMCATDILDLVGLCCEDK